MTLTKTKIEEPVKKEQLTLVFPRNKHALKKELMRMKREESVNVSNFCLTAVEEKLGFFV